MFCCSSNGGKLCYVDFEVWSFLLLASGNFAKIVCEVCYRFLSGAVLMLLLWCESIICEVRQQIISHTCAC